MINRNLIRTRVLQVAYSWYQNKNKDLLKLENELLFGLRKSYDLYYYHLQLLIELTNLQEERIEAKRNKYLPSEEDLNPNTRLIDNRFMQQLRSNRVLISYFNERPMTWEGHESFIKKTLDDIVAADFYQDYINAEEDNYETDKEFWRKAFRELIYLNEDLDNLLEEESIYWNDDVEIVQSFVLKTIRQFKEDTGEFQALLPMFRDEEDKQFAVRLLRNAVNSEEHYRKLIENHADTWDFERIAFMDLLVMQLALAEIHTFDNIPTRVTLNEYIELAKAYSTPKRSMFINGVLDSIVTQLKKENVIFKQ